jgi:hypothetical protein
MNFLNLHRRSARKIILAGLISAVIAVSGCGGKPAAPPAAAAKPKVDASKGKTAAASSGADTNQYLSVFDDLIPPKVRDPFFPDSNRRAPKMPEHTSGAPVHVEPELVLKAVIRTSRLSQAVVNNAILEVGEPAESVHVPGGRVMVRCLEIGDNYAVVQVQGEASPKRLTMERKKN